MKKKILFTLLTILLSPSFWAQEGAPWPFDFHAFRYDMTANVVLQLSGTTLTDYTNYEVGAFCNDECRGIADFQKAGDTEKQVGYLRIYANSQSGDKITFKAYDKKRQREMIIPDAEIAFAENTVQGMPSAPLKLVAYYVYTVTTAANGDGSVSDGAIVRGGNSIDLTAMPGVGHHFVSWTIGDKVISEAAKFTFTPEDDVTLKANFVPNQYTVKFVVDGEDIYNQKQDYGSAITVPEDPKKEGHTFTGWNPEVVATVPLGDVTYTAQWEVNKYMISFDWGVGNQASQQVFGKPLEVPTPERTGYKLTGWDPELPSTVPASDQTYKARWEVNTYSITCELNGGTLSEANPETYNVESATITLNNPTREGYQFAGWTSADFVGTRPTITIENGSTGDRTYVATWTIDSYTISYNLADGKLAEGVSNPTIYSVESTDIKLNNPTREGYTFLGWTGTGLAETTENVTISKGSTGPRSYTANWIINQYTVTFIDRREGSPDVVIKSETLDFNSEIVYPEGELKWEGHVFIAWYAEKVPGAGGKVPAYDLTYTSAWDLLKLKLSYELDGQLYGEVETIEYGTNIEKRADPAVKPGYSFSGWEGFPGETMPAYDVIVKGKFTPIEYKISYDLQEGTLASGETNPETYTIESDNITLKNPSRLGYTFAGWTGTGLSEATINVIIPKGSFESRSYTATWTINQYKMTFVQENGLENIVQTLDYYSVLTAPEVTREGFTFKAWTPEVPAVVPASDQTFTAQWERNSYQLTFIVDGEKVSDATIAFESDVTAPADPTKLGYEFKGWDAEIPEKMPASNLSFNAVFEAIEFNINYELGDGTLAESETNPVSYTIESEDITLKNPSLIGYTFKGWQSTYLTEPTLVVTINKGSTGNRTYTAVWEINQYSVTFDKNNGEENVVITQDYNTAVTAPADPTKIGYTFKGWDKEIPKTIPAEDVTITANWTINQYTITFDTDGGSEVAAIKQDFKSSIAAPAAPTKTGYAFLGWDKEIPSTMPADDMTITAQWLILQFTITFDTDGGSEVAPITQDYDTEITSPAEPTKTGYTFKGWNKEIPATMPAENVTIKAQWEINQYTITFDTDGGSEIAAIKQDYASAITAPAAPTKTGYTFKGWDKEIPATMPAENVTIKAIWTINQYIMTFVPGNGEENIVKKQDYATELIAPEAPAKEGYSFTGWSPAVPSTVPAEDMTFTAQFSVNTYYIRYYDEEGKLLWEDPLEYGAPVELREYTPSDPDRFTFLGWVGDEKFETMPARDLEYKASLRDGISIVNADGTLNPVYRLDGTRVKARNMRDLPAGAYIIGGKRILKK